MAQAKESRAALTTRDTYGLQPEFRPIQAARDHREDLARP